MIVTKNLKKAFHDKLILKGIDQHIEKGEKVVIVGPSDPENQPFSVVSTYWNILQRDRSFLKART